MMSAGRLRSPFADNCNAMLWFSRCGVTAGRSAEGDCRQEGVETSTNTLHLHIAFRALRSCKLLWLNTLTAAVRDHDITRFCKVPSNLKTSAGFL